MIIKIDYEKADKFIEGLSGKPIEDDDALRGAIQKFCIEICPGAEFSYGHIVLGDFNLNDSSINYCLQDDVIQEIFKDKLEDLDPEYSRQDSPNAWERWQYDDLIKEKELTILFLKWLLTIPDSIRMNLENS